MGNLIWVLRILNFFKMYQDIIIQILSADSFLNSYLNVHLTKSLTNMPWSKVTFFLSLIVQRIDQCLFTIDDSILDKHDS